jgi:signal transduction histidine kinase
LRNIEGRVIGCFQSVNKRSGNFNHVDELLTQAFAGLAAVAIDHARAQQEKEEIEQQLKRSERLATLGQLTGMIMHDVSNPLSVVQVCAQLMMRAGPENEAIKRNGERILRQTELCSHMMRDVLSFAKGEKNLTLQPIAAPDLVKEALDMVQSRADEKGLKLEVQNSYLGSVYVDQDRIIRALVNLMNNAFDVLRPGGVVKLSVEEVASGRIQFRVADDGPGIPKEIQETLFDAFVSTGKKNGSGLGLHIAREVAIEHKGCLYLNRDVKEGAEFVLEVLTEEAYNKV